MNVKTAQKMLRTLDTSAYFVRDERKAINKALFALGLPTMGDCRTLDEYLRAIKRQGWTTADVQALIAA